MVTDSRDADPVTVAKQLLAERELARNHLLAFAQFTKKDFIPARHLRLISKKLMDVELGRTKRLMIWAPPRHAKSEMGSRRYPAFFIGRNPSKQIITASANAGLARDFGRDVRNIVSSPQFACLFPGVGLAGDTRAQGRWNTTHEGVYVSASVESNIIGRGAHLLIIDDPFKDRKEAESQTSRDSVWTWYQSSARYRLMPGAAIIVINTRWHEDDLCGRLLEAAKNGDDQWEVLNLPALADPDEGETDPLGREPGEALWPEWYNRDYLLTQKHANPIEFEAQFQQRPSAREGSLFLPDSISIVTDRPDSANIVSQVRAWDLAATDEAGGGKSRGRDPDYTVGVRIGRTRGGRYVIMDVVRFRGGPLEVERRIQATAALDGPAVPIELPQDPGSAGKAYVSVLVRMLAGYIVRYRVQSGAKDIRAAALAAQVNAGNVVAVAGPWNREFIEELRKFPTGKHDDQVDAAASGFNVIAVRPAPIHTRNIAWMRR